MMRSKIILFNNRYASRMYKKALNIIREHGYTVKHGKSPTGRSASTEFKSKIIWLPDKGVSQVSLDSLVVHEAHHVSTSRTRIRIAATSLTPKEIFDWCIEDERQAYTKQYRFLSYFKPEIRTVAPFLIRAQLRFYLNYECRRMEDQAKKIKDFYKSRPVLAARTFEEELARMEDIYHEKLFS